MRVYPLKLGAEGRPRVCVWYLHTGRNLAERFEHCLDYYINVGVQSSVPYYSVDAKGNILDDKLDFAELDEMLKLTLFPHSQMQLFGLRWWRQTRPRSGNKGHLGMSDEMRWSEQYRKVFRKWLLAVRDHLNENVTSGKWALYIEDEAATGKDRDELIRCAKAIKEVDPSIITYCTIADEGDPEQLVELARHVDIIQTPGLRAETHRRVLANVKELWHYSVATRRNHYFQVHRRRLSAQALQDGCVGTGFWVWWNFPQALSRWHDEKQAMFPAVYEHHDAGIIPSLRAEAFREGIEDWKYVLMLDEALGRARAGNVDDALVDAASAFRKDGLSLLDDPDGVYRFRDLARGHLLALHVALGDVDAEAAKRVEAD